MTPTITAFKNSPDRGRGLARDIRVRWALEEVGQPYLVQLVSFDEMKQPEYRSQQPFGQIPAYREGDLVLFESGAIIFHIAETHAGLLSKEPKARARAIAWMFAALNTVEAPINERGSFALSEREKPWFSERMPMLDERVHVRLKELSIHLGDAEWLDGDFSAGDLLMISILRRLVVTGSGMLDRYPNLLAYVVRGEARPAFRRAFAAQLAVFDEGPTPAADKEAVTGIFAAINRNDISALLEFFDPQIERIEPEGFATTGTYRGFDEVKANIAQGRGTWAEGVCEPEKLIAIGDKVVALLHARVRLKDRTDWIDGRFADVFTFKNGKAIQMRTFWEREHALDWAGVRIPNGD